MFVHLSDFEDFVNIFIRFRSKQLTLELLMMGTKMFSTTVFFPAKKLFLRKENLDKFHKYLLKAYTVYAFQIQCRFLFML